MTMSNDTSDATTNMYDVEQMRLLVIAGACFMYAVRMLFWACLR